MKGVDHTDDAIPDTVDSETSLTSKAFDAILDQPS
jgi:hypothetical protein